MIEDDVQDCIELQSGTCLNNGKYLIKKKIGEGGFGITYKALQIGLNREVCIKEYFLTGKCMRNTRAKTVYSIGNNGDTYEKYRQSFVEEAKLLASLHHPNIVEVIDIFDENGTSYMVMPFIAGKSLQNIVDQQGKLSYPDAINYIAQVTDAVGYIHEKHLLHRDIKPDNIMITADYKAILIDFGAARKFEHDKTQRHTAMLTYGYAPPEQHSALSRKGAYTDIYAIGATLYFTLTGEVPIDATARIAEKMPEPKTLSPDIPDEINRTILKAMQIKAENRHQSIQEFMDDLRNIKPSTLIDETIGKKSNKKLQWLIGGATVVIISLVSYLLLRPERIVRVDGEIQVATEDFTGMHLYPMIKVEGGRFTMGDNRMNEDYGDCPPHDVTLSDFYIGQFEVSQGLWRKIMGKNPSAFQPEQMESGKKLTQEQRDYLPVENVSFKEVQEFINRLNKQTGRYFSLPTEAQWEYAARGGRKANPDTRYANGKPFPANIWFDKKHPFGIKFSGSVNELGIYQMSGNVAEWCLDYYDEDFYNNTNNSRNPLNLIESDSRVIRGGSFYDTDPEYVNVFYRYQDGEKSKRSDTGFRLVVNNS